MPGRPRYRRARRRGGIARLRPPCLFALSETLLDAPPCCAWRGAAATGARAAPGRHVAAEEAALLLMRRPRCTISPWAATRRTPCLAGARNAVAGGPPAAPGTAELLEALAGRLGGARSARRKGWRRTAGSPAGEAAGAVRAPLRHRPAAAAGTAAGAADIARWCRASGSGDGARAASLVASWRGPAGRAHLCVTGQEESPRRRGRLRQRHLLPVPCRRHAAGGTLFRRRHLDEREARRRRRRCSACSPDAGGAGDPPSPATDWGAAARARGPHAVRAAPVRARPLRRADGTRTSPWL